MRTPGSFTHTLLPPVVIGTLILVMSSFTHINVKRVHLCSDQVLLIDEV